MVEQVFLSPQVKWSVIISNKLVYRVLGNLEKSGKSQKFIELLSSLEKTGLPAHQSFRPCHPPQSHSALPAY